MGRLFTGVVLSQVQIRASMMWGFAGVPLVNQDASKAMKRVHGPKIGPTAFDRFGKVALDKMDQKRNQPRNKLFKAPTMSREAMASQGFNVASASVAKAANERTSMMSRMRSMGRSLKRMSFVPSSEFDVSTPFGKISDAIALSVRAADDVELACSMCKTVGDVLIKHPEVDVKIAVRLRADVYVAIVDAVMSSYLRHADDAKMRLWGPYAIWRIALANPDHAQYMTSLGVEEAIKSFWERGADGSTAGDNYDERALEALANAAMSV